MALNGLSVLKCRYSLIHLMSTCRFSSADTGYR